MRPLHPTEAFGVPKGELKYTTVQRLSIFTDEQLSLMTDEEIEAMGRITDEEYEALKNEFLGKLPKES